MARLPFLPTRLLPTRRGLAKTAVFLATFSTVTWTLGWLPTTQTFWNLLNIRFAQDARYQVQTLFLPDTARDYGLAIIGDSLFHKSLPDAPTGTARLVINGYDPDDLHAVLRALNDGQNRTETRVCGLVVQVSPLFSLRARAIGVPQATGLMRGVLRHRSPDRKVRNFFRTLTEWANTRDDMPAADQPPLRPPRMVGPARFADPGQENWARVLSEMSKFNGPILGIPDSRETNWGAQSDLIEATQAKLTLLQKSDMAFSWAPLREVTSLPDTGCAPR